VAFILDAISDFLQIKVRGTLSGFNGRVGYRGQPQTSS
jgi:hypothetical protein